MPNAAEIRICAALLAASMATALPAHINAQATQDSGERAKQEDDDRSVRRLGDIVGNSGEDEFLMSIPEIAAPPAPQRPDVRLPDPQRQQRLQNLLDRRATTGESVEIDAALAALMDEVRGAALEALEAGDLEAARAREAALEVLAPELSVQAQIDATVEAQEKGEALSAGFEEALAGGRLIEPQQGSALGYLNRLRDTDPLREDLDQLEAALHQAMAERFTTLLDEGRVEAASEWLTHLETASIPERRQAELRQRLQVHRDERVTELRQQFDHELAALDIESAEALLQRIDALGADSGALEVMRARLLRSRQYGRFEPGLVFADSIPGLGNGPEMVVIPAGNAELGSPPGEAGRFKDEGPRFQVEFDRGFALSRTEITVAQFRLFVQETNYRTDAERSGQSNIFDMRTGGFVAQRDIDWRSDFRGNRARDEDPVTHVSFNDAQAYVAWLAETTAQTYRLPSEAEFEYALRAGSQSRYWWGDDAPETAVENLAGDRDGLAGDLRWTDAFSDYRDGSWGPAPAGSFSTNPFGLYDIGGNQLEWVADCWIEGFSDPPVKGRPRFVADCDRRVLRGGAWSNGPRMSRSAYRLTGRADFSDARVGFRVARELLPSGNRSEKS